MQQSQNVSKEMNPPKPSELFVASTVFLEDPRLPDPEDAVLVKGSTDCVQHLSFVLEPDGHQANLLPMRKALAHPPFCNAFMKAMKFQLFRDAIVFDHFKKATNGGQVDVSIDAAFIFFSIMNILSFYL